jgi:tRNA-dihydrouridine synthase B
MDSCSSPRVTAVSEGYTSGFALAPMAGYTDSAFRRICRRLGATSVVTEMTAAAGLSRGSAKTGALLAFTDEERPIGIQLFGSNPKDFERAAGIVTTFGFSFVDINAGCPVKKVVSSGSGSALLRDIPRLLDIVRATSSNTDLPVTVKIRLGWSVDEPLPDSLSTDLALAGAKALAIHGRYRSDLFSGRALSSEIAVIARLSPIPVLASGESSTVESSHAFLKSSGASGLLVGRGALGNPWIFRGLIGAGKGSPLPGELHSTVMEQLDMMAAYIPEAHLYHVMRGHLVLYFRGFRGATSVRNRAVRAESRREIESLALEADRLMSGDDNAD